MRLLGVFVVLVGLAGCGAPGPAPATDAVVFSPDSLGARVAPGPAYARRGGWWQRWLGPHYRALWARPVAAPVLRLGAAGLQPVRRGGAFQTRALHLRRRGAAAGGPAYVLRSVEKQFQAPAGAPGWLRAVLQDQTCAGLPYGAPVVAQLAQAAGLAHADPRLVYLAPDSAWRPWRGWVAPGLYWLEARPGAAAGEIRSDQFLLRLLGAAGGQAGARLAARRYLRARLLDLLVGDWSRRADQWRWLPGRGGAGYAPLALDRDMAFARFDDGWLPRLVSWLRPRYQSFGPDLAGAAVADLTLTGRPLDQTALALLPEAAFVAEADSLRRRLRAPRLAEALQAAPAEVQGALAHTLLPALQARLLALPAAARAYWAALQAEPVVVGTDRAERFELTAAGPGRLRLRVWARRPPARPDSLLGEQLYDVRRTVRLRVYGLGGGDRFDLVGPLAPGFAVQLFGGAGRNVFFQESLRARLGPGLTVFPGPAGTDLVQVSGAVRVRPAPPGAAPATAAAWVATRYELGKGKK